MDLTQILGEHIVGLSVHRVAVVLQWRGLHRESAGGGRVPPRVLLDRQRTEGIIVIRQRGTLCVGVSARAPAWERVLGLCGEPCPPLQSFLVVYNVHRDMLLALGLPATGMARW